ncbi:PAS domain S-box protein [Desulforegula conservatrix]|uniref:PAS domain S-box protein n=1 Tax=Desulforegula conservatrix TaxID=153026 RepID=UPI0003FD29E7|nr:PAS domain S-box protein [Desulforegula conservatrix]
MGNIFYSLRFRIIILSLLILAPSVWLATHSVLEQREALRQKASAETLGIARLAAANHESLVEGARQLLTGLSMLEEINSFDAEKSSVIFRQLHKKFGFYNNIGLVRLNGEAVASAVPLGKSVNLSDRLWFREAVRTRAFSAGEYQISRATGKAALNFAVPVFTSTGDVSGVVTASIALEWFGHFAPRIITIPGMHLDFLDRNGAVLAGYHHDVEKKSEEKPMEKDLASEEDGFGRNIVEQLKMKDDHGVFSGYGPDGNKKVYAYASLKWANERYAYLLAGIDEKIVFADAVSSMKRNVSYGIMVFCLAAIGAWFFAGLYIIRFVEELTMTARELSRGNMSAKTGIPYSYGEIGFLAKTFDSMTDTIRKREDELRDSEAKYRMVMELAADGIFTTDSSGYFLDANKRGCEMFGYDTDELRGLNITNVIPSGDLDAMPLMFEKLNEGIRVFSERRIIRKDGWTIDIEISCQKLPDGRLLSIVRDVTERKTAEQYLRRNEAMLRAIIENAPVFISITDTNGKVLMVNRQFESLGSAGDMGFIDRNIMDIFPEAIAEELIRNDLEALCSGTSIEREESAFNKDKELHTYFVIKFPVKIEGDQQPFGICSISTDITERKRTERLLEYERSRFKGILDEMNDGVCIVNSDLDIEYINPALKSVFGEVGSKKCHQYFVGSDSPCNACNLKDITANLANASREWKSSSDNRVFDVFSTPIKNDDGSVSKLTIMHEITDLITTEKALFESEANYRLLFETACEAIILIDITSRSIIDVNSAASAMYGYERQDFLRLSELDLIAKNQTPLSGSAECSLFIPVAFHKKKNDEVFPVEITTGHITDRGIFVAFVRDISERLDMEAKNSTLQEQLIQAQKMETVGRLAGGVAHDFNNLLVVIMGYSEMLVEEPAAQDKTVLDYIGEIRKAGEKAQNITKQLLAFGRKQNLKTETIDLGKVTTDFLKMMERLIGEDIMVTIDAEAGLWPVEADVSQIEQVLMNLAVNARDAMPRGGEIGIRTSNQRVTSQNRFFYGNLEPGDYVFLEFSDTGCGMDDETAKHVFDPFYTTKEQGKGTGLGLSTVHGVVKQHGGEVYLKTRKNEGTVFTICIPSSDKGYIEKTRPAKEKDGNVRGAGTIMIVEDETSLRRLLCDVVSRHGYNVIETRNVSDALKTGFENRGKIDLLISDVVMPEMNGPEVAEKLLELCPEMKILFISGYEGEALESHGIKEETLLLKKPFPMDELIKKVQIILET